MASEPRTRRRGFEPDVAALAVVLALVALAGAPGVRAAPPRTDFLMDPHLSWQHDPTRSITIVWATRTRDNGSDVRIGTTQALELPRKRAHTMDLVQGYQGYRHVAEFRDLQPGTTYYYQVGSDHEGWSAVLNFTTAPATPTGFTFLAFADLGTTPEAQLAVQDMASLDYAFSIHAGDISYAGGSQGKWDGFFSQIAPMASHRAYMTTVGNHENESREKLTSYLGRFAMPADANPSDPSRAGLYYSFNYSNVHFVALKADQQATPLAGENEHEPYPTDPNFDPIQTAWLEADLARASADAAHPWIVVYFHYPPFSSGSTHGSWLAARQAWSRLFDRYHVALVITGHDHDYERTYAVRADGSVAAQGSNGTFDNPGAPVYVVTGGGGESMYGFSTIQRWSADHARAFEFLVVQVSAGALAVKALNSQDGGVLDCFQVLQGGPSLDMGNFCRAIVVHGLVAGLGGPTVLALGGAVAAVAVATTVLLVRRRRT